MAANAAQARDGGGIHGKAAVMTLAQESTTLSEGPTITIARRQNVKTGTVGTYLSAGSAHVLQMEMRVDDVAPGSLRTYLDLVVRTIRQEMERIKEPPTIPLRSPDTIKDFVHNMAHAQMFTITILKDVDLNRDTRIQEAGSKVPRNKRRKSNQSNS